ncbi:hypothetical protein IFM47457_07435 [Aspergillus lentulus]|nr:hypothetical protein IFM47457_07435 [Aspergillus lentulus]
MDQQRQETPQQQSRRLQERLDEQFEICDRVLRQEFGRVHEAMSLGQGHQEGAPQCYEKLEQHEW